MVKHELGLILALCLGVKKFEKCLSQAANYTPS
jgi:hypothetical protein